MWEYKTVIFKILKSDIITLSDKLNEFGKDDWEAFSIDKKLLEGLHAIGTQFTMKLGYEYTVQLKKHIIK